MIKLAPSILSADFGILAEEIALVEEAGADLIHIDVMDGRFVPNITIGPLVVKWIKKRAKKPLDVHLMIVEPEKHIEAFAEAGADIITVHIEATDHLHGLIHGIRKLNKTAGVVLNPATPLFLLEDILPDVEMVVLMSVNPGWGGKEFISSVMPKIKRLSQMVKEKNLSIDIEIDGGIGEQNIAEVVENGGNVLVAGNAVFGVHNGIKDPAGMVRKLKKIAFDTWNSLQGK